MHSETQGGRELPIGRPDPLRHLDGAAGPHPNGNPLALTREEALAYVAARVEAPPDPAPAPPVPPQPPAPQPTPEPDAGRARFLVRPRVRAAVVRLEGEYAGVEATMRLNITMGQGRALSSGELGRLLPALCEIILDWNLADADGVPLPVSLEGIDTLTDDLLEALIVGWRRERDAPLAATSSPSPRSRPGLA